MKKVLCLILFIVFLATSDSYAKELKLTEIEYLKLQNVNYRIKDIEKEFQRVLLILQNEAKQKIAPMNKEKSELMDSIESRLKIKLTDYTVKKGGVLTEISKKNEKKIKKTNP